MITATTRPNLYDYLDPVSFISEHFHFLQSQDSELTIRKWALQMGFSNADGLIQVLKRKKQLHLKFVPYLQKGLDLDASDLSFFKLLILHSRCQDQEEKTVLETLIHQMSAGKKSMTMLRVDQPDIFSHWLDSAILELSKIKELTEDARSVSGVLRHRVEESVIAHRLNSLIASGLLVKGDSGELRSVAPRISTKTDTPRPAVYSYYEQVSMMGKECVSLPGDQKEYQCFSMSIRQDELPVLKSVIRKMRSELESYASAERGDSVYQFNLQCFPLTNAE